MKDKILKDILVSSCNCYIARLRNLQLSFVNLTVMKISWILILPKGKIECMIISPGFCCSHVIYTGQDEQSTTLYCTVKLCRAYYKRDSVRTKSNLPM